MFRFCAHTVRFMVAISLACFLVCSMHAQIQNVANNTSTPTPGVGHDYIKMLSETVNPANGSVSLRIQAPIPPGRGITLPFSIAYDTNGTFPQAAGPGAIWGGSSNEVSRGNWAYSVPLLTATWGQFHVNPTLQPDDVCNYWTNYVFQDPSGGRHALHLDYMDYQSVHGHACPFTTRPTGGDDFYSALMTDALTQGSPIKLLGLDGTFYQVTPNSNGSLAYIVEDRNGNKINVVDQANGAFTFTDDVGRTIFSSSGIGGPSNTLNFSGQSYTLNWTANAVTRNYSVPFTTISAPPLPSQCFTPPALQSTTSGLTSITLPNGRSYQFQYDTTYGLIKEIDYPDGGSVKYTWQISPPQEETFVTDSWMANGNGQMTDNGTNACTFRYPVPVVATRTVSFGGAAVLSQSFSYAVDWPASGWNWNSKTTTVTTTDLVTNKVSTTKYNYAGIVPLANSSMFYSPSSTLTPVELKVQTYDSGASTPIRTTMKSWSTDNILLCEVDTLEDGATSSGKWYQWLAPGLPVDVKEYDFGQVSATACPGTVPASPTRETATTYLGFSNPVYGTAAHFSRPSSTITYDKGTRAAETDFAYDETATTSVSALNHDDSNYPSGSGTSRGNLTTQTKKCFVGSTSCTDSVIKYTYDQTGQTKTMVDACGNGSCSDMSGSGHTTTFSYADHYTVLSAGQNVAYTPTTSTNANLTSITNALGQISNFTYDFNNGQLTVAQDPNSQSTTYLYNDTLARPTKITAPDTGQVTVTYNDAAYNTTNNTPSVTTTKAITSTLNMVSTTARDGVDHVVRTLLTSDPGGTDITDTSYDGMGRVHTQSNPYRGASTSGTTTHNYDVLGRVLSVTKQDNSVTATSYSGNTTTVTDEAGKQRRSYNDGLGRLIRVDEPGQVVTPATTASGSFTVSGNEQTQTASTSGSGTVTINGSEQSVTQPGTAGHGSVTISGTEGTGQANPFQCGPSQFCYQTVYDQGSVNVTVNGVLMGTGLSQGATAASVASGLVTAINGNSSSPVTASLSGTQVLLTAKTIGTATNYSLSVSVSHFYPSGTINISGGFSASASGTTLTGGTNSQTVFDAGTVSVTVNGFQRPVSYGNGSTGATLAAALRDAFNNAGASSPVNATASGTVLTLTSKTTGTASNYTLAAASSTSNPTQFPSGSFSTAPSGASLTGGNSVVTSDTGSVWVQAGPYTASVSYSSGSSVSTIAGALASNLNGSGSSPVTASASGATVTLTARQAGTAGNVPLAWGASTSQPSVFSQPSFGVGLFGNSLMGGTDSITGSFSLSTPGVTLYSYDAFDNLTCAWQNTSLTSFGSTPCLSGSVSWRPRSFTYDSFSRLLTAINPESGTISYAYDLNSNVISKTAPKPNQTGAATVVTTFTYDVLNRPTQKNFNDGATATLKYGYDGVSLTGCSTAPPALADSFPAGRITAICDASGASSLSHDNRGRVLSQKQTIQGTTAITKTTSYTYNFDSSLASLTYPFGRVITYTPNAAGQSISAVDVSSSTNYVTGTTYAPQGAISSLVLGSSIQGRETYNSRLQPLQLFYTTGTVATASQLAQTTCPTTIGNLMHRVYNFGAGTNDNGKIAAIANCRDNNRSQNFTYDALNRIQQANSTGPNWGETFTIDAWGNLTNRSGVTGKTTFELLNASPATTQNRLPGFGYDAAGNMTSNGSATYTYDGDNHLVTTAGVTYTYDGIGNRVKKSSGTLYWMGGGGNVLTETDLSGTATADYIFFNRQRVARVDQPSGNKHFYIADHLGSASVVTNNTGAIQDESDYYPYGGEMPITDTDSNRYKFDGKERDSESGLDNFGARYDSSNLGRFMTPDWAARPTTVPYAVFGDPQSLNLYGFVFNDPINNVDADGHECGNKVHKPCEYGIDNPCQGRQDCFATRDEKAQTITVTQTSTETAISKNKDGEEISTTTRTTNTETVSTAKADKGTILGGTSTTTITTSNLSNPGSDPTVQRSTTSLNPLQAKQSISPELTTGIQEMAQPSFFRNIGNHPLTAGGATVGVAGTVACAYLEPCGAIEAGAAVVGWAGTILGIGLDK